MKKSLTVIIILGLLASFAVGGVLWLRSSLAPVSLAQNYQGFLITKGMGASQIANKLAEEKLIKSALAFKVYTQFTGISKRIGSGEYRLSPHMGIAEIVSVLTSAPLEVWVTVPEGYRREQIAERFAEGLQKPAGEADAFKAEFLESSKGLEGFLFPDTYLFPREASASAVVSKLKRTFDVKTAEYSEDIEKNNLALNQIVTLASIIERETKTDSERPLVAGVLLNRLAIGMPLQADATLQYVKANNALAEGKAVEEYWGLVYREDYELASSYNTYKNNGLPPSPIANPGISSLKAAINPEDSDYFYYIHDKSGKIYFAKTLDEHNANVQRYLN